MKNHFIILTIFFLPLFAFSQSSKEAEDKNLSKPKYSVWIVDSTNQKTYMRLLNVENDRLIFQNVYEPTLQIVRQATEINAIIVRKRGVEAKFFGIGMVVGIAIGRFAIGKKSATQTQEDILIRRFKIAGVGGGIGLATSLIAGQIVKKTFIIGFDKKRFAEQREKLKKYTLTGQ